MSIHEVTVTTNASDMAERISSADLAVSAGGTTVWELACLGTPAMVGITAPIEEFLLDGLARHGLFMSLGNLDEFSDEKFIEQFDGLALDRKAREEMSVHGQQTVDGYGIERIIDAMTGYMQ
jgi:spore coat polysaccharide biosynthesis predicted glycosyltransferase SpsG